MIIKFIVYFIIYFIDKIMPLLFLTILCYVIYQTVKNGKKNKAEKREEEYRKKGHSYPDIQYEEDYDYYTSAYYLQTHLPMNEVIYDKGKYGEYMVSLDLQVYKDYGAKLLFNSYLPKGNDQTTEVDIIMLTLNGIFVFEIKNYSGWIFGNEKHETWMQTIPAGNKIHKEKFYNPIMQNKTHIKAVQKLIGYKFPIYSIIVFSNACTLQNIEASDPMTELTYFGYINSIIDNLLRQKPNSLTQEDLTSIYEKLYPYTQVQEEVRKKHAKYILEKKMKI